MPAPDIIAAVSTPPGRGGIGVVRVSGRDLRLLAEKVVGSMPKPRYATLSHFLDEDGQVIDQGIALYFPAPHSYTGEDVLEFQGHGGPIVMSLLLASCISAGARLAEPGEFTLRAFFNDKLDLAQAESVADLIDAGTREAARSALRSLNGEFSSLIHEIVSGLTDLRMIVEAWLDFPEEDIDVLAQPHIDERLGDIRGRLDEVFLSARRGSLLREGVSVVLVGKPNVGKSSLLNQLTGEEAAIVTEVPGTTRDTIERPIEIKGVPMHVVDTAGLRETEDLIESIGIERTRSAIEKAALALVVLDCREGLAQEDRLIIESLPANLQRVYVYNKIDLMDHALPAWNGPTSSGETEIYVSAKTGAGMEALRDAVLDLAGWNLESGGGVFMARQRHLVALSEATGHLTHADDLAGSGKPLELLAEELRLAQIALSSITGEFTADDLLGEIFSRFCIGK
ncbi:MAG TPA: tRNA uridine-5-carboxymethylaminomethyl(34) synthesis GTPase MnmE [Nitrosospira sp.]|nr:tRNA uridine-5-carboxymethylaminomethyl(34) synthesis GTPase MnmE [Nitrosospira sp.]